MRVLFGEWELEVKERRMMCHMEFFFFLSLPSSSISLNTAEFSVVCVGSIWQFFFLEQVQFDSSCAMETKFGTCGIAKCKFSHLPSPPMRNNWF